MTRSTADAITFAFSAGVPMDAGNVIHIDAELGAEEGGRRLLATVEPLEQSSRAAEIASAALTTLREAFADASALAVPVALARAFAAANARVREENRLQVREGWGRRVDVGATMVVLEGRDLTIAQVPPTQAIVVQDGQLYAFPCLQSWGPNYLPVADRPTPQSEPLGYSDHVCPDLYRTVMAPGDLVLLCSTAIARCLAGEINGDQAATSPATRLIGAGAAEAVARLEHLVEAYDLDRAHAGCLSIGGVPGSDLRLGADALNRIGEAWAAVAEQGRLLPGNLRRRQPARRMVPAPATGREQERATLPAPTPRSASSDTAVPQAGRGAALDDVPPAPPVPPLTAVSRPERPTMLDALPAPVSGGSDEDELVPETAPEPPQESLPVHASNRDSPRSMDPRDFASLARVLPPTLSDGLAVGPHVHRSQFLASLQAATLGLLERVAPKEPGVPPAGAARAALVPGALGMRCYRGSASLSDPPAWRMHLPRGPVVRIPRRVLVVLLTLLVLVAGAGITYERYQARTAERIAALAMTDEALNLAAVAGDPATVRDQLDLAQRSLATAADRGAGAADLMPRRAALAVARDRADGIVRLTEVTRLGALPSEMADRSVRLIRGDREIFVVGGGFYRLSPEGDRLVQMLAPGAKVGKTTVGDLNDGGWDATGATATDGTNLYAMDSAGKWTRRPMGLPRGGDSWGAGPSGAFEGSFYLLDRREGRIMKFAGSEGAKPEDWVEPGFEGDLVTARDFVVDGRIYVLLADGRILSFYRGELEATLSLEVGPLLHQPVALYGGQDTQALYVADGGGEGGGRIVQVRRDGSEVRQLMLPVPAANETDANPLAAVQDFVVDEANGTIYFVTGDALWRAVLPAEVHSA